MICGCGLRTAYGVQCFNDLARMVDISLNCGQYINRIDTQAWYIATTTVLDLISLVSVAGPLKEVVMTCKVMKSASSMKGIDWLKRYPRMERVRLTEGIIKQLNPGISNRAMIRARNIPNIFPQKPFTKN